MTDTEKAALERRIDELCAEVERLRKYTKTLESANLDVTARLQDYIGQYDPTDAFVAEVKAENAKLREFIRLKETCWKYVGFCDACPYNGVDEEHYDFNCTVQKDVNLLARELRIGVDE